MKVDHALQQELLNSLTLRYQENEMKWLNSLPSEYTRQFADADEEYDPSLYTHYGEFFLTLCGIKPCLLITSRGHPTFAEDLVHCVLQPLIAEIVGFELFYLNQGVVQPVQASDVLQNTSTNPSVNKKMVCRPDSPKSHEEFMRILELQQQMQTQSNRIKFVLTSRYHHKFFLIREVFLKAQSCPIPTEVLAKALGSPVPGGDFLIQYIDQTSSRDLGINCIIFEYTARSGFDFSIRMHFEKCAAEFLKLGKELVMICQQ
jgi:hypothetical protein